MRLPSGLRWAGIVVLLFGPGLLAAYMGLPFFWVAVAPSVFAILLVLLLATSDKHS